MNENPAFYAPSPLKSPVLRLMLALSAAFVLLILAMHLVGSLQPLPQAMTELHLDECALPCWIGITPGKTTFDDALDRLSESHPMNVFVRGSLIYADYQANAPIGQISLQAWNGVINLIHLTPGRDANLALGDIVQRFGTPGCEIPSSHTTLVYTSPDAFAAILVSREVENRWRKPLINIEIRGESALCEFFPG
jgi:hypothetical protein